MPLKPPPAAAAAPPHPPTYPQTPPTAVRVCSEVAEADNFSFIISSQRMGLRWGEIELSAVGRRAFDPITPRGGHHNLFIWCPSGGRQLAPSFSLVSLLTPLTSPVAGALGSRLIMNQQEDPKHQEYSSPCPPNLPLPLKLHR